MANKRTPIPAPTFLETAVSYVAPGLAGKMLLSRWQFNALQGGYKGARRDRRATYSLNRREQSADSAILPDLPELRGASQELIRNNPLAAGAINTKVTSVIGTGLKVRPEPDGELLGLNEEQTSRLSRDLLRAYSMATDTVEIDITRRQTFVEMQDLIYRSAKESGDVAVLKRDKQRPGSKFSLKLQVIEAGRLSNPGFKRDTARMAGGIEVDADGAPKTFHFANSIDGTGYGQSDKWVAVPAFDDEGRPNVLHIADRLRPDQTRGVPDLAGVIEPLKQLSDYTDGELQAAVISSFFTVFVKTDDGDSLSPMEPTAEMGGSSSDKDYKLGPGAVLDLESGDEIQTANPGRPNDSFDPFVQAILRQIGVRLEIPFEILIQHFTASYSAARAALLSFWKYVRRERVWFTLRLCQPVYEDIIAEAAARGMLSLPGFFQSDEIRHAYLRASWYGDAMPSIDPKKENEANIMAVQNGWKTDAQVTAETTGGDWHRNMVQRKKEIAVRQDAGISASEKKSEPDSVEVEDRSIEKPEDEIEVTE